MNTNTEAFLITFNDGFLGQVCGCDLRILSPLATAADMLEALDAFAAQYMADCRGCDGCCRERAPLTCLDVDALATLLPDSPWPVHSVCGAFSRVEISKTGVSDITLRRDTENACLNLDSGRKICRVWPQRAFVCRSHFCLPRSDRLSRLRQEIVNAGINELTRLLLAEEAAGAPPLPCGPLAGQLTAADYADGPLLGCRRAEDVLLKEALSPRLWQELCRE